MMPSGEPLRVHIAGESITVDDRFMRQRCGWCGAVLIDYDLARVAVPVGQDRPPSTWPVGALVAVDGNYSYTVDDSTGLPPEACARSAT